jgi:hypothetical protein
MRYCSKCGSANFDDSAYCARCGTPLEQAPSAGKEMPAAPAAEAPQSAAPERANTSMLWMILNIVATVLCCPGFPFSIVGIVFAALGSESFNKGNMEDARRKSTVSMAFFIVGAVLGLAGWIAMIALFYGNLSDIQVPSF